MKLIGSTFIVTSTVALRWDIANDNIQVANETMKKGSFTLSHYLTSPSKMTLYCWLHEEGEGGISRFIWGLLYHLWNWCVRIPSKNYHKAKQEINYCYLVLIPSVCFVVDSRASEAAEPDLGRGQRYQTW